MMKKIEVIGVIDGRKNTVLEQISRVCGTWGVCPTISTMAGGNRQPKVVKRMDKREICGNCKYCHKEKVSDDWDMICVNSDSEYCADWVEYEHSCDSFERRE